MTTGEGSSSGGVHIPYDYGNCRSDFSISNYWLALTRKF